MPPQLLFCSLIKPQGLYWLSSKVLVCSTAAASAAATAVTITSAAAAAPFLLLDMLVMSPTDALGSAAAATAISC